MLFNPCDHIGRNLFFWIYVDWHEPSQYIWSSIHCFRRRGYGFGAKGSVADNKLGHRKSYATHCSGCSYSSRRIGMRTTPTHGFCLWSSSHPCDRFTGHWKLMADYFFDLNPIYNNNVFRWRLVFPFLALSFLVHDCILVVYIMVTTFAVFKWRSECSWR